MNVHPEPPRRGVTPTQRNAARRYASRLALSLLAALLLTQAGCLLTSETPRYVNRYNAYTCRATLVDIDSGEQRMVSSADPTLNPVPGSDRRVFFDYDWDADGERDVDDALLEWRRYIADRILTSPGFAARAWCVRPPETSCSAEGRHDVTVGVTPTPLPTGMPDVCPSMPPEPRLEVSAPGLTADRRLALSDTPIGVTGAPVNVTVTNVSTVPLRLVAADFTGGGGDAPDFEKTADACAPTPAETAAGLGHLLAPSAACSLAVRFRPQYRAGAGECDRDDLGDERCRRRVTLAVTSTTDADRRALAPVSVAMSGRAIGARLVVEPLTNEVCFLTPTPSIGSCTETRTIRIRNEGARATTGDLTLTFARLTRTGDIFNAPPPFLMGSFTLEPGLAIDVPVQFCNRSNDPTDGLFTINSSAPRNPTVVVTLVNPLNRRCP